MYWYKSVYIYICIDINLYIYIYIYVLILIYMCMYWYTYVYIDIRMYTLIYICIRYTNLYIDMHVYIYIVICICIYINWYTYVYIDMHMNIHIIYICVHTHMSMTWHIYIYIYRHLNFQMDHSLTQTIGCSNRSATRRLGPCTLQIEAANEGHIGLDVANLKPWHSRNSGFTMIYPWNMVIFRHVNVYQRVNLHFSMVLLWFSYDFPGYLCTFLTQQWNHNFPTSDPRDALKHSHGQPWQLDHR